MDVTITEFDLNVRYHIYRFFAERCQAPTPQDIARVCQAETHEVREAFRKLHARHMIFLEPGAETIRMANPFSAIPTKFRVRSGPKAWWANCAWDALGIAAALEVDVHIEARYADADGQAELWVKQGAVDGQGHVIYFPLPCRQWYDDLVFT
jgi:hypothetical protein